MKVAVVLQQMQSYREREIKGLSPFWLLLHFLCCLVSTVLGFRFSRLLFFLFFSSSPLLLFPSSSSITTTTTTTTTVTTITTTSFSASLPPPLLPTNDNATATATATSSTPPPPPPAQIDAFSQPVTTRPVVGRHGIRVRPWPHPHPEEVMRAHHILRQVQLEQRRLFSPASASAAAPRPLLVVTPTFVRPTQALHLTALAHTLRLVPYPVTWVVVEAGGISNGTASLLARSRVPFVHVGSEEAMPDSWEWEERRIVEAQMRLRALRLIARQQMDGVVIFADESNVHDLRLFDEAQKLQSLGSIRLSFLTDPRTLNQPTDLQAPPPVQAPLCDSHGRLSAWRMLDPANHAFAPHKMEWAGFLLDSKWLFRQNLDSIDHTLNALLGDDGSAIQPLGDCGERVLVWWIRADTLPDAIFPPGWAIENGIPLKSETNSTANRR